MSFCKSGDDLLSHKARANERVKACLHTKRMQPRFVILLNKKRVPKYIGTLSKKTAMAVRSQWTDLASAMWACSLIALRVIRSSVKPKHCLRRREYLCKWEQRINLFRLCRVQPNIDKINIYVPKGVIAQQSQMKPQKKEELFWKNSSKKNGDDLLSHKLAEGWFVNASSR